ncbi:translesion DNA synthesis-associated protein ImuA [Sinimarinibacterium thermocellulolyticum]|uniref:Translesion DNA synthesis-associated protein ImuA n=1 Tax=Sinimarinibacterium thermocellulolyticum TaxID=3170016 RepID=A0ABV2A7D0_9GAMM
MRAGHRQSLPAHPYLWRGADAAPLRAQATGWTALDALLPGGGWPCGALSEVLYPQPGAGELTLVLPLLARLTGKAQTVAFIAPPFALHAPALARAGVDLPHTLVVETRNDPDALWSAEQLLHARTGAVLLWAQDIPTTAMRRLQLAAERGDGLALLLRPSAAAAAASVAALRLGIERIGGVPTVEVLKCRGARPVQKITLAAPAPPHRPAALPARGVRLSFA